MTEKVRAIAFHLPQAAPLHSIHPIGVTRVRWPSKGKRENPARRFDESRSILASYAGHPKVKIELNQFNSGNPFKQWNKGVRWHRENTFGLPNRMTLLTNGCYRTWYQQLTMTYKLYLHIVYPEASMPKIKPMASPTVICSIYLLIGGERISLSTDMTNATTTVAIRHLKAEKQILADLSRQIYEKHYSPAKFREGLLSDINSDR